MARASSRRSEASYENDFALWTRVQSRALREGQWDVLDIEHLADELDALGKSDARELKSRLIVLFAHQLKETFQPERASRSWAITIREQARRIVDLVAETPSLRQRATWDPIVESSYAIARNEAADETELPLASFPQNFDELGRKRLVGTLREAEESLSISSHDRWVVEFFE